MNELITDLAMISYWKSARKYISFSDGRAILMETNRYENVP